MTLRLNPALDGLELYQFALDTGHWDMLDQIADHPHAWPALSAWARRMAADPQRAELPPEPPEARRRGLLYRPHPPLVDIEERSGDVDDIERTMTIEPSPADAESDERNDEGEADEAAGAVTSDAKPGHCHPKWLMPVAALCTVVLVAVGGVGWHSWDARRRVAAAKLSCADSAALVKKNRKAWEQLLAADDTVAALKITDKQVADVNTVAALADAAVAPSGKVVQCDAGDAAVLTSVADANGKVADSYESASKALTAAVAAVTQSRDAKTLADAQSALRKKVDEARKLLSDSDGKVQDNATRDALSKAVDAADKGASGEGAAKMDELRSTLESAMKQVNDSIAAKSKADEEAAAQAAAEAAAAAPDQSQAQQSWTPSTPTAGGSGSWSGGSGWTGGAASSGGDEAGDTSPGWAVPSPTQPDPFGTSDPSL